MCLELTATAVESLAQGIASYAQAEATRRGGVFTVNDPSQKTSLGLTLVTVHRERLSRLADLTRRSSLEELTTWVQWADRALVF